MNKTVPMIVKKLEKLDNISRKKWLSKFPYHFPNEVWNGHWHREETMLIKSLDLLKEKNPNDFNKALKKCNVEQYYISTNHHNNKVGLDSEYTPQGGGVIAQSNSFDETKRIAFKVYGINKYFIH